MSPEKLSMKEEDVLTKEEEKSSPIVVPEHVGNGPRTKEQQIRMEKLSEPVMGAEENARRRKEIERRLEGIEKDHDSAWKNKEEKKALGKELVELEGSNKKEKEQDTEEEGSEEKAEDVETNEKLSMDTAKEVFLLKYTDYIKKRRLRESLGISKKEEDWPDELKDLMSKYRDTKISYMQSEYRNRKKELFDDMPDMSNADDIDIDAARRMNDRMDREYFTAEIFNDVELSAQEEVQKAKVEAMGTKEKNLFMKGVEWYSKKSVIPKVLFSTAVVTGALAGG
ncbi:MAG TPA: hypothetical protein ENI66_01130, partial [Candidatus Yonathbacteria bacterium]|nr:hypothetical protein [Candidatus Yonathbacteria bacterium]